MLPPRISRRHGLIWLVRVARKPNERLQLRVTLVGVDLWDACFALFVRDRIPNGVNYADIDAAFARALERRLPGPDDLDDLARLRPRAVVIRVGLVGRRDRRFRNRPLGGRLGRSGGPPD